MRGFCFVVAGLALVTAALAAVDSRSGSDSAHEVTSQGHFLQEWLRKYGLFESADKFMHAFLQSFALILVSELGDKTFIIAVRVVSFRFGFCVTSALRQ